MALMQTFLLLGLDALLCTAEVKPGQKRVRFQCEQDPTLRLEWDFAPPPDFRSGRCAPADLRKDAGAFDLPIALGMLVATGQLLPEQLRDFATMGELALDGSVRPIKGALSMAMAAASKSIPKLLVPAANAREAAVVEAVQVFGVNHQRT